jgi:hypothetical protein
MVHGHERSYVDKRCQERDRQRVAGIENGTRKGIGANKLRHFAQKRRHLPVDAL